MALLVVKRPERFSRTISRTCNCGSNERACVCVCVTSPEVPVWAAGRSLCREQWRWGWTLRAEAVLYASAAAPRCPAGCPASFYHQTSQTYKQEEMKLAFLSWTASFPTFRRVTLTFIKKRPEFHTTSRSGQKSSIEVKIRFITLTSGPAGGPWHWAWWLRKS